MSGSSQDKWMTWALLIFKGLVLFSIAGSAIEFWFGIKPGPVAAICSFLTLLCGGTGALIWLCDFTGTLLLVGLGVTVELIGLTTGLPFGHYEYSTLWIPTIAVFGEHRFPLLLPLAWVIILVGSYCAVSSRLSLWRAAIACGAVAMIVDWPMERAMCQVFKYWSWTPPGPLFGAPIQNSIGWFFTGVLGGALLAWRHRNSSPSFPMPTIALAWFCLMVAFIGWIHGFDMAWLLLISIAMGLLFVGSKGKPRLSGNPPAWLSLPKIPIKFGAHHRD